MLKVDNVCACYGSFQALSGISLEVHEGEIVALIGANSSGKSTLLDAITGINHPTQGKITFQGQDITHALPHEIVALGISHVPEGRKLFPSMSVEDNLTLGSFTKRARSRREENLKAVFKLFPRLEERKKQLAKTLSGGEQQMLAVGRGLMSEPKLILLDEMSLGLSPKMVNELYKALVEIKHNHGVTILFVEQNVRRSLEEADRAYILKTGCVAMCGCVADLKNEEAVKKAYFGLK